MNVLLLFEAVQQCTMLEAAVPLRAGRAAVRSALSSVPHAVQKRDIQSRAGNRPGGDTGSQLTGGLRGIQIGKVYSFRAGGQLQASHKDSKWDNYNYYKKDRGCRMLQFV